MTERVLNAGDINSQAWVHIKDYYQRRLQHLREQNDGVGSIESKALIAGRIAEVKELLALDSPAPVTAVNPID